jgi:hypothetical protein
VENWTIIRSRIVAGPGGVPLFSQQRRRPAQASTARGLPYAPTNPVCYTAPLPFRRPKGLPRIVGDSWRDVILAPPYARILAWIKRAVIYAQAVQARAPPEPDKHTPSLSKEVLAEVARVHRPPANWWAPCTGSTTAASSGASHSTHRPTPAT